MYVVGKVLKPQGIKGELKVEVITSFPEHFTKLKKLYIIDKEPYSLRLESVKSRQGFVFVKFEKIDNIEQAEKLRGQYLYIPEEELYPLAKDEYYHHQLIGLKIFSEDGEYIGELKEIESYAANDVYIVEDESNGKLLIPAIKDIIKKIDLNARRITIHVMEGLLN